MRDEADPNSCEVVLYWRELYTLPRESHLKALLIVLARNLGHADTRTVERRYGHLSASYVADDIRRAAPRFGTVSEDGPAPAIGGVR